MRKNERYVVIVFDENGKGITTPLNFFENRKDYDRHYTRFHSRKRVPMEFIHKDKKYIMRVLEIEKLDISKIY